MEKCYGYIRVSSTDQNEGRQLIALTGTGCGRSKNQEYPIQTPAETPASEFSRKLPTLEKRKNYLYSCGKSLRDAPFCLPGSGAIYEKVDFSATSKGPYFQ